MMPTMVTIQIPDDLDFSELQLARRPDGSVSFAWPPIERICAASGLDKSLFDNAPEDNAAGLIVQWYAAHRANGGAMDAVAEDLIAEVLAENEHGSALSYPPGRA